MPFFVGNFLIISTSDLLKRHSANHSSGSTSKRQKKEIVRQSRVVQACEACSFHHLRCEVSILDAKFHLISTLCFR